MHTVSIDVQSNRIVFYPPSSREELRRAWVDCDPSALTWQRCFALADAFSRFADELRIQEAMDRGELP